jgi:hypothetical protein
VLHEVDFKQLKIENKQYMTKIDEKNNEMIKLKKMVGLVTQTLNYRKVSVQILVLSIHEQSKLKRFLVLN